MYEELIKRLRWMEDVCKKDISCPVPCINECLFKEAADAIEKLVKERDDWKTTAKLERDGMWEWFEAYQKDVPLWIPVTKRLPDSDTEYVLCCGSKGGMFVGWAAIKCYDGSGRCTGFQNSGKGRNFTHWMPLPEPPKDGEA